MGIFCYSYEMKKGFTLIELLVVVSIIGVLATIVLGSLNDARSSARDARRQQDIRSIQNALEVYYLDNGEYPIRGFTRSYNSSWEALEAELGVVLPRDPINESGLAYNGDKNYIYYSLYRANYGGCPAGQWYALIYNPERIVDPSENPGVTRCDNGQPLTLGAGNNAITVGFSPAE